MAGAYGSEAVAGIYGFEGPEFGGFKYVGNGNNNAGGDVDNGDDDDFTDDMESELPGNVNDEVKPKDFGSDVTNLEGSPSDTVTSETETTAKASNSIAPAGGTLYHNYFYCAVYRPHVLIKCLVHASAVSTILCVAD